MCRYFLKVVSLLLLFGYDSSFAMKRTRDISVDVQKHFDESFALSMPRLDFVKKLKEVKNINVKNLSLDDKLFLFEEEDSQKENRIDAMQAKKVKILNNLPKAQVELLIHNEFKKIEEKINQNVIDAQNRLLRAYGIHGEIMETWKPHLLCDLEAVQCPWDCTTWDHDVPENFVKALIDAMQEYGLDPGAFNVKKLSDKDLSDTCAALKHPQLTYKECSKGFFTRKNGRPACILYDPDIADDTDAVSVAFHEVYHALQPSPRLIKKIMLDCKPHLSSEGINKSPVYAQYVLARENAADILPALKNAEVAQCMLDDSNIYYGSYGPLKMIHTNFEILGAVERKDSKMENV